MAVAERSSGGRVPLGRGEFVSALSGLVLLISMFAAQWYGVVGIPGRAARLVSVENAWQALPLIRWLMLATALVPIGSAVLHFTQRSDGERTRTAILIAVLGTLTSALLIYRVLIELPSPDQVVDQKLGAFVGVASTIGVALGGYESARARRVRSTESRFA